MACVILSMSVEDSLLLFIVVLGNMFRWEIASLTLGKVFTEHLKNVFLLSVLFSETRIYIFQASPKLTI